MREFCEADGNGQRLTAAGRMALSPLLDWPLEPAWDEVVLIAGYQVGAPIPQADGSFTVDVQYTVTGRVTALAHTTQAQVTTVTFRVHAPDPAGWRLLGPPAPPHVFVNRADVDTMRLSLSRADERFVANSNFVWLMYRGAGWNLPYQVTASLADEGVFRAVEAPARGDIVVYLRDGVPYHVGILEGPDQVVSSTLNAGIVRTSLGAFQGEVRFLRLVEPVRPGDLPIVRPPAATDLEASAFATPTPALPGVGQAPRTRTPQPRAGSRVMKSGPRGRAGSAEAPKHGATAGPNGK